LVRRSLSLTFKRQCNLDGCRHFALLLLERSMLFIAPIFQRDNSNDLLPQAMLKK
jgi:hypothetical protein